MSNGKGTFGEEMEAEAKQFKVTGKAKTLLDFVDLVLTCSIFMQTAFKQF